MAGRCIEMMGGAGFVKGSPVEKFYRDSKIGKSKWHSLVSRPHPPYPEGVVWLFEAKVGLIELLLSFLRSNL